MIIKERTIPIRIQKNEALLRRLPKDHIKRQEMEEDLRKRWAGYRGEQAVDYYLGKLPDKDFLIFHGIRLSNSEYLFQIDTLILTPYFALILEIKNYSGTLYFDPTFNQWIQTTQMGEKGYPCPIEQANQQKQGLKKWLEARNISIPIDFLVIISKPSTILKTAHVNTPILQKVLHVQFILDKIQKMKYKDPLLNTKELKRISRLMLKEHKPETLDILTFYKIHPTEIITGVICSNCMSIQMTKCYGSWICPECKQKDPHAHVRAVDDYFLLFNDSPLSNQKFRDFLHLTSPYIANRLLLSMNLPFTGSRKDRIYHSSETR
ncbi:NERD domain-containing protein [Cytobacillus solani]|uniref:nuclease-related domain-containing protein n=1 Tax=Cytobacillus solani TaxID=1637975 RepID=UPI00207AFFEB|nr:nuclease-related domain-containing protein [Cytobacillus solani]USK54559.1 NERD domain-containing protein [Cytobacillus solani]